MISKRVYCHTSYDNQFHSSNNHIFLKDNWYFVHDEHNGIYTLSQFVTAFSKSYTIFYRDGERSFSYYFYTEQEYNRIINLKELLNG